MTEMGVMVHTMGMHLYILQALDGRSPTSPFFYIPLADFRNKLLILSPLIFPPHLFHLCLTIHHDTHPGSMPRV